MKRFVLVLICIGLGVILVLDSAGVAAAVTKSVQLCLNTIIPSLFAFLVLSTFVTSSGLVNSDAAIFIISMAGGYPVGAKLLSDRVTKNPNYRKRAESMLMYCYCGSPVFLVALSSLGIQIWMSNVLACLTFAIFSNVKNFKKGQKMNTAINCSSTVFINSVTSASTALYKICTMIILFGIITRGLTYFGITDPLFHSLVEITNTVNLQSNPAVIAALTSTGGVCIIFQVSAICGGKLNLCKFLMARIPIAILSGGICRLITGNTVIETIAGSSKSAVSSGGNIIASVCLIMMTLILIKTEHRENNAPNQ